MTRGHDDSDRPRTLSRRDLLKYGTATAAVGAVGACAAQPTPRPETPQPEPASPPTARGTPLAELGAADWETIRNEFAIDRSFIHLACLLISTHPRIVREAIEAHRDALDRNPSDYLHHRWAWEAEHIANDGEERAVRAAAKYLATRPELIALTDSTTMGLATLYNGLVIRPDQEIVTTDQAHWATRGSVGYRAQQTGCSVRAITPYRDSAAVTADEIVGALAAAIGPRTRALAITWVHSNTGVKLPIADIADVVARANRGRAEADRLLLCVDGVHGFGVEDVSIDDLRCDFFVAGCHKWLFGPRGTGLIWGAADAWQHATPTIPSFSQAPAQTPGRRMTPGGFHSFEHRWALDTAFEFHLAIGRRRVRDRTHALAAQLKAGLAEIPGVTVVTPASETLSAGIVIFRSERAKGTDIVAALHERKIIASTAMDEHRHTRITPGLLNSPAEIDRTLAAIREIVG